MKLKLKNIFVGIAIVSSVFGSLVDYKNAINEFIKIVKIYMENIPEIVRIGVRWAIIGFIIYFTLIGLLKIYNKFKRKMRKEFLNMSREVADYNSEILQKIIMPKLFENDKKELSKYLFKYNKKENVFEFNLSENTMKQILSEEEIENLKRDKYGADGIASFIKKWLEK